LIPDEYKKAGILQINKSAKSERTSAGVTKKDIVVTPA
jgi:hypothetical protein